MPRNGSALVYWDGGPITFDGLDGDNPDGSATPPDANIPPRPPTFGQDPHSYPRNDVKARAQKSAFLMLDGTLENPCTASNNGFSPPLPIMFENGTATPCYSNGWGG